MAKRTLILTLAITLLALPSAAFADSQPCDEECPSGKVMASFADGVSNASCVCVDAGAQMQPTDDTPINCSNPNDDGSSCN